MAPAIGDALIVKHDKNIYAHLISCYFVSKNYTDKNSEEMAGGEADKLRLLRIAMEGFNMLDACRHRPNGRNGWAVEARPQNQNVPKARVYHETAPVKAAAGSVIDSNEAAKVYGGMLIAEYPKKGLRLFA